MYEIDIPIIIDRDLAKHEYNSFARGYHAYEHLESCYWGDVKVQTGTNKQRRQRCSRNHAIRFNGKIIYCWALKTSQLFLKVSINWKEEH